MRVWKQPQTACKRAIEHKRCLFCQTSGCDILNNDVSFYLNLTLAPDKPSTVQSLVVLIFCDHYENRVNRVISQ